MRGLPCHPLLHRVAQLWCEVDSLSLPPPPRCSIVDSWLAFDLDSADLNLDEFLASAMEEEDVEPATPTASGCNLSLLGDVVTAHKA